MRPSKQSWLVVVLAVCGCATPGMRPVRPVAYQDSWGNNPQQMAMAGAPAPHQRRGLFEVVWDRYHQRMGHQVPADGSMGQAMACQNVMNAGGGPVCMQCQQQGQPMPVYYVGQDGQPVQMYSSGPPPRREHRLLAALFNPQPQRLTPIPMTTTTHTTMTSPATSTIDVVSAQPMQPAMMTGQPIQPAVHQEAVPAGDVVLPQTLSQLPEGTNHNTAGAGDTPTGWTPVGPNLFVGTARTDEASHGESNTVLCSAKSVAPPNSTMAATPSEAADMPPGPPVHLVSGRSIKMNYKLKDVGPSGVSQVDLWFTQDGKKWQKAEQSLPPQPPYTLNVKEDGLYGFTLLARNGLGLSKQPPMVGDAPQIWVDVDTAGPQVQLGEVKFGVSAQVRQLVINWKVADKHLTAKPISLSYAEKPEGPWMPIASNIENTGTYLWQMPAQTPTRFLIRVEAVDMVGNAGMACSHEPIVIDLSQPSVYILSVEASKK